MNNYLQLVIITVAILVGSVRAQNWRDVWRDDFDGPARSRPSRNKWIFDTGTSYPGGQDNWGTGEVQTYTTNLDNLSLDGRGHLMITPRRNQSGNWTSARIETRRSDFKPSEGGKIAIEGRIRYPNVTGNKALGYWPAFWAMGSPFRGNYHNWPVFGEFDIMESINGLNFVKGVLHCGVHDGGPCNEPTGLGLERRCPGAPCRSDYHVYRFEWDDGTKEFRWYVNGQQYFTVTRDQIGEETWDKITSHQGYFLLLNVAMGGGYPDYIAKRKTPTPSTEPGHSMLIDYVVVSTYD